MDGAAAAKDVIKYTTCGGHCSNGCILKVRVRDGVIASIEPDDTVNPGMARDYEQLPDDVVDRGILQRRPCGKAYSWLKEIYSPDRLIYPMKRVGQRGEAKFERITWDEAINTVASKLVEVKKKHGPYSIVHHPYSIYGGCSFPLAQSFRAGFGCWGLCSSGGSDEPQSWVLGKDPTTEWSMGEFPSVCQDELNIFDSKLIVLWGMNLLTTWTGRGANNLLRAKKRGIPIICIEPRYTPTVEVLADQWIPIRATTDVSMMIAMANVWFKEDLCDNEFIARHVEPEGLARWKGYVLGRDDGVDKTPKWAEEICGVPAETIEAFARLYAGSKPVNLITALTLGRQFWGENVVRAGMYLQALTGNTCIPGGSAAGLSGYWFGQLRGFPIPFRDVHSHSAMPEKSADRYEAPVLMRAVSWGKAIVLREKMDKGEISPEEYNSSIGNAAGNPCPNIKMVIMEGNNFVATTAEMSTTIEGLKKVDFTLVWAYFADQDTARYADILLPLPNSTFEGEGEPFWGPGWWANDHHFVLRQKCIEGPGEVRPCSWFWTQVAKKLGIADQYNPGMVDVPYEKWHEALEQGNKEAYEKWRAEPQIVPLNPPTWEEFLKKPVFRFDASKKPYYAFKEAVEKGENPFRGTASGKIEFYSETLAKGPEYLAKNEFPPGKRCYGAGNLPPMAQMLKGGKDTFYSEDAKKYPLLMSTPHAYFRMHTALDNNPLLRDDCYRHAVWMSPADARQRGIKDNDLVRVYNDVGEMIIPAYVTQRIVPGNVAIHHGAWYRPSAEKSALMPDGVDRGGASSLLIHMQELPDSVVGTTPCKGLVQIEKREVA